LGKELKIIAELRWDPTLREWVLVSNVRERRPWLPKDYCPLCPGTEETGYGWDVLIIENKYPMLMEEPPEPSRHRFYVTSKAIGKCYVVIETPKHDLDDLSDLSCGDIVKVINAIKDLMIKHVNEGIYEYFLWFRNKGDRIGVSLKHPHSQIYVLPFIPTKVERELMSAKEYWENKGRCLFCDIVKAELRDSVRVIYEASSWVAFLPFYAHWPYEVHIYPKRHVQLLTQLSDQEVSELAEVIKKVLCGLKKLFSEPMPYIMVLHQAPLRGDYSYYHLHIEVYGVFRGDGVLKYVAGMELGGGNFTYDSIPEESARRLRDVVNNVC